MTKPLERRTFLGASLAAAAAAVAFSPETRAWGSPGPGTISIPHLDGQLLSDPATLALAGDDFGHIVHKSPNAVLVPGSVDDIVRAVKFARQHGIKIGGARGLGDGQSHSTQGQAQVQAGILIDMSALNTIHEINAGDALVDAGVRWINLLQATVPLGKSPPTLTDYIELSVGGTLSVGGIGGQAFRHGLQVDNVIELDVVTGKGELVNCSATKHPLLFNSVRGGLGQFGIIVRARVKIVPVAPMVRVYAASYSDIVVFTADQLAVINDGRFDYVEGSAAPNGSGGWTYSLDAAKYFAPASPPNDAALLAGLSFTPGTQTHADSTYFDFANRLAPTVAFLKSIGAWGLPHPWVDVFLPSGIAPSFVQGVLDDATLNEVNQGPVLLYPVKRDAVKTPFVRVPDGPRFFLFDLLRNAIPPIPPKIDQLVAANRVIYDDCVAVGGKRYPIDSVPMSHADWQAHFSPLWILFVLAKIEFDPDNILAPGQGIF
ncbi:MAG: FAD-binding protein [Byssovorax sp.]